MTEREFTRQVIRFAQLHGWLVVHFRAGLTRKGKWLTAVQGNGVGWPDLFLCHPKRRLTCAAELKVGRRRPTPEQEAWLVVLERSGVPAYLWTPADWDEIELVLTEEVHA